MCRWSDRVWRYVVGSSWVRGCGDQHSQKVSVDFGEWSIFGIGGGAVTPEGIKARASRHLYPLIHFACFNKTHLCFLPSFSQSTDSFGKSNVAYITWIVGGILVAEGFTGGMTDMLWSAANSGRLYESVDWTKFVVEDDDDEDDDDDDEDEDEEEGDDDDEE